MGLTVKYDENDNFQRELPEPGAYNASCVWLIDLGEQEITYKGVTKNKRKVKLWFELEGTKMNDGRPFFVSTKRFTLSLHPKAGFRPFLESWRGKPFSAEDLAGFDLEKLMGASCLLNIIYNEGDDGNTYANIGAIMPMPKGTDKPKIVNDLIFYNTEEHDENEWGKIPEGIRNGINRPDAPGFGASTPGQNTVNQEPAVNDVFSSEDIPF